MKNLDGTCAEGTVAPPSLNSRTQTTLDGAMEPEGRGHRNRPASASTWSTVIWLMHRLTGQRSR